MGYWLGNVEFIHENVEALAIVIVFLSVIPIVIEAIRHRKDSPDA
jgi:membrane-associated protein